MPVLFRTAHPPSIYKASPFSCASFFRLICLLIQYLVPILICVFWYFHASLVQTDTEMPIYTPGEIEFFSIVTENDVFSYPMDTLNCNPQFEITTNKSSDGIVTTSDIKITAEIGSEKVIGFNLIFNFTAKLGKWATGNTVSYGMFTAQFPSSGIQKISCRGTLKLEQKEVIDFRGELPNDVIPEMHPVNIKNLNKALSNVTSIYYMDWEEYTASLNTGSSTFTADFHVNINNITVIHSSPLISIIEQIMILYLSTYILVSLIFYSIQHYIYSTGALKTYRENFYTTPKKH